MSAPSFGLALRLDRIDLLKPLRERNEEDTVLEIVLVSEIAPTSTPGAAQTFALHLTMPVGAGSVDLGTSSAPLSVDIDSRLYEVDEWLDPGMLQLRMTMFEVNQQSDDVFRLISALGGTGTTQRPIAAGAQKQVWSVRMPGNFYDRICDALGKTPNELVGRTREELEPTKAHHALMLRLALRSVASVYVTSLTTEQQSPSQQSDQQENSEPPKSRI